jgi:hypothetical protein
MKNMLKTLILAGIVLFAGTTLFLSCTHDEGGLAGHSADGPNEYDVDGVPPNEWEDYLPSIQ